VYCKPRHVDTKGGLVQWQNARLNCKREARHRTATSFVVRPLGLCFDVMNDPIFGPLGFLKDLAGKQLKTWPSDRLDLFKGHERTASSLAVRHKMLQASYLDRLALLCGQECTAVSFEFGPLGICFGSRTTCSTVVLGAPVLSSRPTNCLRIA
jgi:hypothetical protein